MIVEDDGNLLKLEEDMISDKVIKSFQNRFINNKERFAIPIYDGKCILLINVDNITPVNIKSK